MKKADYEKKVNELIEARVAPLLIFRRLLRLYLKEVNLPKTVSLIWIQMFPNKKLAETLLTFATLDNVQNTEQTM